MSMFFPRDYGWDRIVEAHRRHDTPTQFDLDRMERNHSRDRAAYDAKVAANPHYVNPMDRPRRVTGVQQERLEEAVYRMESLLKAPIWDYPEEGVTPAE